MRRQKRYSLDAVNNYMNKNDYWQCAEVFTGSLLDDIVIYHANGVIEILKEVYENCWSSAYERHVFRKGLPKKWQAWIDEKERELDENLEG